DVIDDQPPAVHFNKPGRDTQASPVEELFLEARADDDYGVKTLQLFYSANGAPPKMVPLFSGPKPLTEVSAGHTIYLEELGLKAGDFVSYYAKATDTDAVQGPKTATSDIYFVQIRPFKKDYKPAQSSAMGGGGGGGGQQQVGELSRQQREIVAATVNVVRDNALSPEQKALKLLQEAEEQYELQVSMQQGGGGGGGGGQNAMAEDLADLFELELDKLANQYEMQQRAEQQRNDYQVDELVEKL